jgi:hypothetical protein
MGLPSLVLPVPDDLARVIDAGGGDETPARSRVDQGVQVDHLSIAVKKGGVAAEMLPECAAHNLPKVIDASWSAFRVKHAKVPHPLVGLPYEHVVGQGAVVGRVEAVRYAHDLAFLVDSPSDTSSTPGQVAEVLYPLVALPKKSIPKETGAAIAGNRHAPNDLPGTVHGLRRATRTAEVLHPAFTLPKEGPAQLVWIMPMHTRDLSPVVDGKTYTLAIVEHPHPTFGRPEKGVRPAAFRGGCLPRGIPLVADGIGATDKQPAGDQPWEEVAHPLAALP